MFLNYIFKGISKDDIDIIECIFKMQVRDQIDMIEEQLDELKNVALVIVIWVGSKDPVSLHN